MGRKGGSVQHLIERACAALREARGGAGLATGRVDAGLRQKLNRELTRAGLDGNGRFSAPGRAWAVAFDVLQKHGVEPDKAVSLRPTPKGVELIDLAFSNPDDPFSPVPITNSLLRFTWERLSPSGRPPSFEVLAYVS